MYSYIHESISLHHTIDNTDNISLHTNKNTLRKKETYTQTNIQKYIRQSAHEKNSFVKHTYRKVRMQQSVAMNRTFA